MQHKQITSLNSNPPLPKEIWLLVFIHLSPEALLTISLSNSYFLNIVKDNQLWQIKSYLHFPFFCNKDISNNHEDAFLEFKNYYKEYNQNEYKKGTCGRIAVAFQKTFTDTPVIPIKKIFSLVKEGDLDSLKAYKIQYDDLNIKDTQGISLWRWARKYKHQAILDHFYCLIEKDIFQLNPINRAHNKTLLYWSIVCNQSNDIISKVIKESGDLSIVKNNLPAWQAIHLACREGRIEIVKFLLHKQPLLLNQPDNFKQSPLLWAASCGHADIVEFLASRGANLNQATRGTEGCDGFNGYNALHWATLRGHLEVVVTLFHYNCDLRTVAKGYQAIHIACCEGRIEIVKFLLEKHPDLINQKDSLNQTPVLWAASRGHTDIVELLAAHGANLYHSTYCMSALENGHSPLHWAAAGNHAQTVQVLLRYNAWPLQFCSSGKTPDEVCDDTYIKDLIYNLKCLEILIRVCDKSLKTYEKINTKKNLRFNLFNYTKKIDSNIIEAAHTLKAVILGNANETALEQFKKELNSDELSSIYSFYKSTYDNLKDNNKSLRP